MIAAMTVTALTVLRSWTSGIYRSPWRTEVMSAKARSTQPSWICPVWGWSWRCLLHPPCYPFPCHRHRHRPRPCCKAFRCHSMMTCCTCSSGPTAAAAVQIPTTCCSLGAKGMTGVAESHPEPRRASSVSH
ncbi:unnamed protein product [Discosporangium mesarthrocarpum]